MNSQPTNIPEFARGDSVRARTMNHVASITKANSNNSVGTGMHSYSNSSGIAHNIALDISKKPVWAMIVGIEQYFPPPHAATSGKLDEVLFVNDYFGKPTLRLHKPNFEKGCQHYVYKYQWAPLTEDRDLSRHGSEIFGGFIHDWPKHQVPNQYHNKSSDIGGLESVPTGKEPLIYYPTTCRAMRFSTDYGPKYYNERAVPLDETDTKTIKRPSRISDLPLYEVNNSQRPLGYIGKIYYGMGNYMLMASPFVQAKTRSVMFFDPVYVVQDPDRCCDGIDYLGGGLGTFITDPGFYSRKNDSTEEFVKQWEAYMKVFYKLKHDNVKYFVRRDQWRSCKSPNTDACVLYVLGSN